MTTDPSRHMPAGALTNDAAAPIDVASGLMAALPSAAAAVRRAAFNRLRNNDIASGSALAADTGLAAETVRAAVGALVRTGTATVDHDGRVVAVAGLSIVPSGHELMLDGRPFWTWCVDVTFTAGQPTSDGLIVGWLPGHACTNVQVDFCPTANLFCDRTHLSEWRAQAGNPPGRPATLSELAALGRQVWAEMAPPAATGSGQS